MRKTFLFILALCAASAVWGTPKSGLIDGTYYIASKTDLEGFRDAVNGGQYSLNAVQTADIDFGMTSEGWDGSWQVPIGTTEAKAYTGTYDGQGYTISNFLIYYHKDVDTQLKTYLGIGLFGVVKGATLKNIHITCATENKFEGNPEDMKVKGCGILCGQMQDATTIEDCSVEGGAYVGTASNTALLCGNNAGSKTVDAKSTINRCWVSGTLRIGRTENFSGILGYAYNVSITNSYNLGTLNVVRDYKVNVGGILGYGNADKGPRVVQLSNCYNYGTVKDGRAAASQATTQTLTLGAIAGNDRSSEYASVSNLYFLTGSCASAGSGIVSSAVSKSAEDFKTLAASLGDEFVDGTDYPVLAKLTPALEFETSEFEVIAEAKSSIENALVGLVEGAYPNFGALTYELTGDAIGTLVDGTANVNLNGATGTATITASVAGSNYYKEAVASYTITVKEPPTPIVTFPNVTDSKKSVALDVESFTEAATVDMTVPVVYSSSNENVAMVDNNGEVTVLTTGTTEITAKVEAKKGEYKEASATYTLTVTASEASEVSFVEKYGNTTTWDNYPNDKKITGTDNIFYWVVNKTRRKSDDKIGSNVGLRFGSTLTEGYHLLPDPEHNGGIMEGGIKRIAFTYKEAEDGSGVNLEISAGEVSRSIKTEPKSGVELSFAANFLVKENTSLKMFNTNGASVVTIGPISIVPYLLFTTKSDEAFLSLVNEYDIKNVLIDNTDDGEVVYSILTADHQSQISNDGVVTFDEVTESETITIQAAWTPDGESSATVTTTMTLYVDVESKTDKTVEEKFSNYGETGWASSEKDEATKNGDVYDWRTKRTRHRTTDKLKDGQQAIWFDTNGYVATADAEDNTKIGPAEGGIKRIAFDWNQNDDNQTGDDLYISISVDNEEVSAIRRDGGEQPAEPWQYIHNLNVKKNATLKIENKSTTSREEGGRVKIGTIVITPYLLYTTKSDEVKLSKGTYVNTDLINNTNTDGTITFSAEPNGYVELQENPTYPGTFELLKAGEVTITATWIPSNAADGEIVTTSYVLKINDKEYMDAHFATEGKLEKVLGNTFTNAVTYTKGEGTATYISDDPSIAEVNASSGEVTIKGIGTTTIKAHLDATENYFAWDGSYTLVVRSGVTDDKKLVEGFSNITTTSTTAAKWEGDLKDYFSWNVNKARRSEDKIADEVGVWMSAKGSIATEGVIEGGIKYFTFNWMQPSVEKGATLRLNLAAGEKNYHQDYVVTTENGGSTNEIFYFAGDMQVKKNVQLTLTNESFKTDGGAALTENGRIVLDKFEIVPYLFYTTKSHTIDDATIGETYTNTDLINNIDKGAVTYSLIGEGADEIAEINADNGLVTVKAGGVVTVQAKWVPEGVGEDEFVTTTYELTINFPQPTITFNNIEVALDGTVTPDIRVELDEKDITETATISYEVADENIATWDATDGWKLKTNGTTQVTANVARTTKYGPASKTAKIEVTNIIPAEGTYWTETFSSIGNVNDYIESRKADIVGDSSIYSWAMRNYRRRQTQADSLATEQAIRLSNANNNYIETLNNQEGGIKHISFNWRTPGTEADQLPINLNVSVCYNNNYQDTVKRPMTRAKSKDNMTDNLYCSNFFVKQNAKLKIDIADETYSVMLIGPITITPYLLYTKKVVEKTYVEGGDNTIDVTENLINNLEAGEEVTYSLSAGAQAQIDGSTITLANVTEDVIVTAKCGEVSTTFTLKVTAKTPDFTLENKTAGAFATICLPKKIDRIENGTLYSISYGDKTSIEFVEADYANDDAGMPYLVQVTADGNVNFYYGEGDAVTEPVDAETAKGFVGKLAADDSNSPTYVPEDGSAIIITGGQLHIAGAWCVLTQNHAYIDATKLPTEPEPVGAPRRTIRLYNPDAAPTNLNGLNGAVKPMKVLRDGQFYIIRDTKTYNAQGIEVQ